MEPRRRPRSRRDTRRSPGVTMEAVYYGPPVGPGMSVASPGEVARAMQGAPSPDDWDAMALGIVPVFERRRPFPVDIGRPIRTLLAPGVTVTVAYDYGPALMRVTDQVVALWRVDEREIFERAVSNLRARVIDALARKDPVRVVPQRIDDIPIRALVSGEGWASTLLLLPDLLERVFGRPACLFIAPMRDLLVALPADVDVAVATWLTEEFESLDPNCLCLEAFAWDGDRLTVRPLAREAATA